MDPKELVFNILNKRVGEILEDYNKRPTEELLDDISSAISTAKKARHYLKKLMPKHESNG